MEQLDYELVADRFLTKQFDNLVINISIDDEVISAKIAYDNDDMITHIPERIHEKVIEEIQEALK